MTGQAGFRAEFIGDIAIVKPPYGKPVDMDAAKRYADELMKTHKFVKSVWLAAGPVSGPHKVRPLEHLAGERRTVTIYKEHGCSFVVDVARDFITPRLSYEHARIARLVRDGEVVVNMFAGVGLFSIIIAKHARPRVVHSIDINPDAYAHMVENIRLNKVEGVVVPYLGDAAEVIVNKLTGVADRVLMPLPDLAIPYLRYAVAALRERGAVHVYLHVHAAKGEDPEDKARRALAEAMSSLRVTWSSLGSRVVRMVGPRMYQVVVDAWVEKSSGQSTSS